MYEPSNNQRKHKVGQGESRDLGSRNFEGEARKLFRTQMNIQRFVGCTKDP